MLKKLIDLKIYTNRLHAEPVFLGNFYIRTANLLFTITTKQVHMNRLTLMQTQSPVPIRFFNSNISVEAANATLNSSLKSSLATASEKISRDHADSSLAAHAGNLSIVPSSSSTECLMLVTIKADSVADLRHLVMRTCGELIVFIKTQPIAHATKMKVWLCLSEAATDKVMDAVMRSLPSAEFGRITHN